MKRLTAILCALVGALALPAGAFATQPVTTSTTTQPVQGHASGTLIGVARGSFAIEAAAGRMSVVNALTSAANLVTEGDFPYVYGGGHAQAGIASIGIKGPGYNGRRIGFDCSGSVAAVLSGAGVWQPTSGVPNDAGIIAELLQQHLIGRGAGHGATEVTLYDDPGVHIFMNIDGRFFGTSDGGGGGNPNGGAVSVDSDYYMLNVHIFMNIDGDFFGTSDGGGGANPAGGASWLDDGAPDAWSHVYKKYHLLLPVLQERTTFMRILTFQTGAHPSVTHGLELGSDIHVGYTQAPNGRMTAKGVS